MTPKNTPKRPGFTMIPNEYLDYWIANLKPVESVVLLYISRKILGWRRDRETLTLEEICTGTVLSNGRRLDHGTKLAKSTVSEAIKALKDHGLIRQTHTFTAGGKHGPSEYELCFQDDAKGGEQEANEQEINVRPGEHSEPTCVVAVAEHKSRFNVRPGEHPYKEERNSIKESSTPPTPSEPETHELPTMKLVRWRLKEAGFKLTPKQVDALGGSLAEIAADRGAEVVAQLVDEFPAHIQRMDRENRPPREKALVFFLGYLRKWNLESTPDEPEHATPSLGTTRHQIVASASNQPPKNPIVANAPDPVQEFLDAWDAGPCAELRVVARTGAILTGVKSCLKISAFRDNQAEIIRRAHALKPKQGYITLAFLLRDEKWAKLLNGDYDWSPSSNGGGKRARHDVTSGPDALAAYAATIDEKYGKKTGTA